MKTICRSILAALSLAALPSFGATTYVDWTLFTADPPNDDLVTGTVTNGNTATVTLSTILGGVAGSVDGSTTFDTPDYTAPVAVTDEIWINGGTSQLFTLSFSNPVVNPRMHVFSLGGGPVTWSFSNAFSILSFGGNLSQSGTDLIGDEGNGTIQFAGTFSTLAWTTDSPEFYASIQVGVENVLGVPEPSRSLLFAAGLACTLLRRRRR